MYNLEINSCVVPRKQSKNCTRRYNPFHSWPTQIVVDVWEGRVCILRKNTNYSYNERHWRNLIETIRGAKFSKKNSL